MGKRTTTTIILAGIMVLLVMCAAAALSFSGMIHAQKVEASQVWSQNFSQAQSMKIIDLTGDGQDDLFIQNQDSAAIYDANGNQTFSTSFQLPGVTTLGDVTGDNVDDILIFHPGLPNVEVISKGQVIASLSADLPGLPARIIVVQFASGPEIILGDASGHLMALSPDGQTLWQARLGSDEIRGLDDVKIDGQTNLVAVNRDGQLAVIDAQGYPLWNDNAGTLRRMRAYDLDGNGTSEVITGGEYGAFTIWNAADGSQLHNLSLGQAISELRAVELNGDPSSMEIVAGGKNGGVWGIDSTGKKLWSHSLSDKVTEIAGIDINGDGAEEAVVGDDSGQVAIFSGDGGRENLASHASGIMRIDAGKLGDKRMVAIADGNSVEIQRLTLNSLPGFQFTPLLVGLIVSAIIIVIAWVIATLPPKPELKVALEDKSRESLEAQRRMLKENIADVERLRQSGEMTADAYLARLKQLRSELAANETAFKQAGYPVKVETFQCPHCGGTLELGMDKCEYCGQVILT
jgi:outer membrane protein assembly factor BamB